MPWYFREDYDHGCSTVGCTRTAVGELRNRQNEVVGRYCKKHGEALAERFNKEGK